MKRSEMIKLSWQLLEHKYRYYIKSKPIISDYDYDMLEKRYEKICKELGEEPTSVNMVDFNASRVSCQIVAAKIEGISLDTFREYGLAAMPRKNKETIERLNKETKKINHRDD